MTVTRDIDTGTAFLAAGLRSGECLRQVGRAEREGAGFVYSVTTTVLPADHYLAAAQGAENRLEIETVNGDVHRIQGLGAGRWPTATAMCADIFEHASVLQRLERVTETKPKAREASVTSG